MQIVFIVGLPRSGTTLVQQILGSATNKRVFVGPETHFFRSIKWYFKGDNKNSMMLFLSTILYSLRMRNYIPGIYRFKNSEVIKAFHKHLKNKRDYDIVVEKTPDHYQYYDLIKKYIPEAKWVFVQRNFGDIERSTAKLMDIWYGESLLFNNSNFLITKYVAFEILLLRLKEDQNIFALNYDRLTDSQVSKDEIQALGNYIGANFSLELTDQSLIEKSEFWKVNNKSGSVQTKENAKEFLQQREELESALRKVYELIISD